MTTFDEARAACVARWGEPTWERPGRCASWDFGAAEARLYVPIGRRIPSLSLYLSTSGEHPERADWMLAGPPTANCPSAPLPDALDAAVRWMAERAP